MSYCEIYGIRTDGALDMGYALARNAWGGAMHIWSVLALRHNGTCFNPFDGAPTWRLFGSGRLAPHEQAALGFTFDGVWVRRANVGRLAAALAEFAREAPTPTLAEIVAALRCAADDDDLQGVCFNQTSVNGDAWTVPMTLAEAETEGYDAASFAGDRPRRAFVFGRDAEYNGHTPWELFEEIEELARPAPVAAGDGR